MKISRPEETVHRARLPGSGLEVQHPGIAGVVENDLRNAGLVGISGRDRDDGGHQLAASEITARAEDHHL